MTRSLCLFVALLLLARLGAAQRTWIVDMDNRAGADFTDIGPALTAAAPGDIIRIRTPGARTAYPAPPGFLYGSYTVTKPLNIFGDISPARPNTPGFFFQQGPGDVSVVANVEINCVSITLYARGSLQASHGALAMENVRMSEARSASVAFTDCDLAVISHCELNIHAGVQCTRSTLMVDDSLIVSHNFPAAGTYNTPDGPYVVTIDRQGIGGTAAIEATDATVLVSGSTLIGAAPTIIGNLISPAVDMVRTTMVIGKGCSAYAGAASVHLNGGYPAGNHLSVDPGTVTDSSWRPDLVETFVQAPQTGLRYQVTPATLQVTHLASPLSMSVLAIGSFTPPWSTPLFGPVCVDPFAFSEYWVPAPLGTVIDTFPIPPGLPLGYQLALQCFELRPTGEMLTSNAVVAGIRQ